MLRVYVDFSILQRNDTPQSNGATEIGKILHLNAKLNISGNMRARLRPPFKKSPNGRRFQ